MTEPPPGPPPPPGDPRFPSTPPSAGGPPRYGPPPSVPPVPVPPPVGAVYGPSAGYGYAPRTDGYAIASLVCALVGLVVCGYILGVLGVVFGFVSRSRIAKSNGMLKGEGMALAGIVVGFVALITGIAITIWLLSNSSTTT